MPGTYIIPVTFTVTKEVEVRLHHASYKEAKEWMESFMAARLENSQQAEDLDIAMDEAISDMVGLTDVKKFRIL